MSFENRPRNMVSQTSVAILDAELMKLLGESFELSGAVDGFTYRKVDLDNAKFVAEHIIYE